MKFEIVGEGLAFPEGPVVLPDGSVLVVEILGGRVMRLWGDRRSECVADLGGGPNGAQLGPDGALYVCNNGGIDLTTATHRADGQGRIERVDLHSGRVERVLDACDGVPLSAPNDLVFDAAGGFWFTDMGKTLAASSENAALLYCPSGGGATRRVLSRGLSYNGVGLSPDGKTLYLADTKSARLWKLTLDGAGQLSGWRSPRHSPEMLLATIPGDVGVDSLAVTAAGNVCVATLHQGGIATVSPDGAPLRWDRLPDHMVTNIAFGGPDMRTAFITMAGQGLLVRTAWPEAGLKLNFGPA